jgi:dolichyl-phosphate-mannose--protein O-mannosyl transferase
MLVLLASGVLCASNFYGDKADIPLSYYSIVKPSHVESQLALSSMEYMLQGGSKQQMTRAIKFGQLAETFWTIFPPLNGTTFRQGDPIRCGDAVRFYHMTTHVWLHAKKIPSFLNTGYEVTGSETDQPGNEWIIQCSEEDGPTLAVPVTIKNAHVGCFLSTGLEAELPATMAGHWEVYCDDAPDRNEWNIDAGMFVNTKVYEDDGHDET